MPRRPRAPLNNAVYHVLSRGNNRAQIFYDDSDYQSYCHLMAKYFPRNQLQLYHYCLMPNHVHLIVHTTVGRGLSHAMHGVLMNYALAHQRKYGHVGHVWQGRFKSLHISTDEYLTQCGGYVELNPVRAGLVSRPEDYPWSSYRYYALGKPDSLLNPSPLYQGFGHTAAQRQRQYRKFIERQSKDLPDDWLERREAKRPGRPKKQGP